MRCNFCMNAGLQNTFHPMRSAFGVVICPVLKETVCNNCNEKGHTPKYCEKEKTTIQTVHNVSPVMQYLPIAPGLALYTNKGNDKADVQRKSIPFYSEAEVKGLEKSYLNPNAQEFYPNYAETPFSYLMNPSHSPTLAEYQKRRAYLSQQEKEEVRRRIANDFEAFVRTTPFGQYL